MSQDAHKYALRGVSAHKGEVHAAIKGMDKGLYPNAFCKILPDVTGGDPGWCNLMHADTAGTKTSLAYLYWKETGDLNVWKGIAQDALVMNLDDMACVGCVSDIVLSSTIGRNKHLIPGEVIAMLIQSANELAADLAKMGVILHLSGGETADVGDIVRTIDVGYTAFARMPRASVLECNIQPGDVIVGFASFGQTIYESAYNSGIGSNGLTSARHDVLSAYYAEHFPETYAPHIPESVRYTGKWRMTDEVTFGAQTYTAGQLLTSPTRTFLPLIREILRDGALGIHALIHCTGGAQTKVLKFAEGVEIVKNNLFPVPPVFQLIQESSGTSWEEMYQVFNMGHRLEAYVSPGMEDGLIQAAAALGIEARVIGEVRVADQTQVTLTGGDGKVYVYR